jgi:hypothetical protein
MRRAASTALVTLRLELPRNHPDAHPDPSLPLRRGGLRLRPSTQGPAPAAHRDGRARGEARRAPLHRGGCQPGWLRQRRDSRPREGLSRSAEVQGRRNGGAGPTALHHRARRVRGRAGQRPRQPGARADPGHPQPGAARAQAEPGGFGGGEQAGVGRRAGQRGRRRESGPGRPRAGAAGPAQPLVHRHSLAGVRRGWPCPGPHRQPRGSRRPDAAHHRLAGRSHPRECPHQRSGLPQVAGSVQRAGGARPRLGQGAVQGAGGRRRARGWS